MILSGLVIYGMCVAGALCCILYRPFAVFVGLVAILYAGHRWWRGVTSSPSTPRVIGRDVRVPLPKAVVNRIVRRVWWWM